MYVDSWSFFWPHVLEDGVLDHETQASLTEQTMTDRFIIDRIEHLNFIEYYMGLSSKYVLLLAIRKGAIIHHYVTKQNGYIDLLVTIESRIADLDILSVLEQHREAILIFRRIINKPHIVFRVNRTLWDGAEHGLFRCC